MKRCDGGFVNYMSNYQTNLLAFDWFYQHLFIRSDAVYGHSYIFLYVALREKSLDTPALNGKHSESHNFFVGTMHSGTMM